MSGTDSHSMPTQMPPLAGAWYRFLSLLPAMGLLVLLGGGSGCGGSDEAKWDRSGYQTVDLALQPLRQDFESYFGQIRIVAVVSPSCGDCLDNCESVYTTVLPWAEENDAEIFVIWGSVMPSDTEIGCADRIQPLRSPRIHHYWDNSGRATRAFGRMLGLPSNGDAYDIFLAYGQTATWDPSDTMDDEPRDFSVALSLWEPTRPDVAAFAGNPRRVPLPQFSAAEFIRVLGEHATSLGQR